VYASPPDRTPPILQAILVNVGILYSMPLTKLFVKGKAKINYFQLLPLLALAAVVLGIGISIVPSVITLVKNPNSWDQSGAGGIIWIIIFIIGVAPGAVYNVLQERFLARRARDKILGRHVFIDELVVLLFGCIFQVLTIVVIFPVDFLPKFGFSENISGWAQALTQSCKCFVNAVEGCSDAWWLGIIFNAGYIISYLGTIGLNNESANYGLLASTLTTPVAAAFWLIFSNLNPNPEPTPWYYVVPATLLLLIGTLLWKFWELREEDHLKELDRLAQSLHVEDVKPY